VSCVAPHRLAEFARGGLTGRGHARIAAHVDDCGRCRDAVARLRDAQRAFAAIAEREAPELRWDRIRAQTYWTTGSLTALPVARPSRARAVAAWAVGPLVLAGAAAAWFAVAGSAGEATLTDRSVRTAMAPLDAAADPTPEPVTEAAPLVGVVTLVEGRGEIVTAGGATLVGGSAVGAHRVGAGDRLIGDGRLAVQFGPNSTFTVGPRSAVVVARLDDRAIELVVEPAARVDVEVAARAPGQRFVVHAGARAVEVRGTAFRVERGADGVAVACEHGRVAVSSADATVELGAGQKLAVGDREPLLGRAVEPMELTELSELAAARPAGLPLWTDPETIFRTTAALPLLAPTGHAVAIDGVPTGTGSLWRRLPPGRHLIETTDPRGQALPGRWVEIGGEPSETPVVLAAEPELTATGTAAARRARLRELSRAIDAVALRGCVRSLSKQGLAEGTHVELEVGVSTAGAIRYLNVIDTDLPDRVTACVRDVVGRARLTAGAQVAWRHTITF